VEKSCGKSVACTNRVRNFYGETWGLQIFISEQERAALWPQRNAYGVKLKDALAITAELLNRVALKSANLPEDGNFLLIQLKNVRMPGKRADEFRGRRINSKVYIVKMLCSRSSRY
jgi:hypothetical protein